MAPGKVRSMHFPASFFLLLLMASCNCWAAATEGVGLEDDEDNYMVGSFHVEFRVNVSCSTGDWFDDNIASLTERLQNDIADGIRRDCEECPFENHNLEQIVVTCSDHKLDFRAFIQEWISNSYPVSHILRKIEERFNGLGEDVIIMTDGFTSTDDLEGRSLSLMPTNVSTQYTAINSGSGEGVYSSEFMDPLSYSTDAIDTSASDLPGYVATPKGVGVSGCKPVGSTVSLFMLVLAVLLSIFVKLLH